MDWSNYNRGELVNFLNALVEENTQLKCLLTADRKAKNILFTDYIINWLENRKNKLQDSTYVGYHRIVYNYIVPYFSDPPLTLGDLSADVIDKYYNYLLSFGLSANTVKRHHANIHKCLDSAVKNDLIPKNYSDYVDLPKVFKPTITYLSAPQLLKLLKTVRYHKIYPAILLCCLGLRRSEAIATSMDDISGNILNLQNKVIYIPRQGKKVSSILKTQSSYRKITIPEFILGELFWSYNRKLNYMEQNFEKYSRTYTNFFCVDEYGYLLNPDYVTNSLREIVRKNNFPAITPKGLRHTCATLINDCGYNLKHIQEWLGHSSIDMTANTYTHVSMDQKHAIATDLHKLFVSQR